MERVSAENAGESVADPVKPAAATIEYYTDPLCCWSWALEPVWASIRRRLGARLIWRTILGGMLEDWTAYRDPLNDVNRPAQMAPLWHHAGVVSGVPIDPGIWHQDPPASSFPASVAVKAAGLQGGALDEAYLALVREAAMTRRLNVSRRETLQALAVELAASRPRDFDADRFAVDLVGAAAVRAFTADLEETRMRRIGRFPTFVVHGPAGSRIAVGYRPQAAVEAVFQAVGLME